MYSIPDNNVMIRINHNTVQYIKYQKKKSTDI